MMAMLAVADADAGPPPGREGGPWPPPSERPAAGAPVLVIVDDTVLPIPGAKDGRQAADNAGALSFRLSADEVAALDRATRAWRGRGG